MTTLSILITLGILLTHWFADFVFQTDAQAKGKSKDWGPLLSHTITYSTVFFIVSPVFFWSYGWQAVAFTLITFVAHTITDYFTSRINSRLWAEGKVHNFFVSVGFDQFLHFVQLLITYYLLSRP